MRNLRGRAALRGAYLEPECYKAHISVHEYGEKDDRIYCHGLYDMHDADMNLLPMCQECMAHVDKATPL